MKPHRIFFLILCIEIAFDLFLGVGFVAIAPLTAADFVIVAALVSHLVACIFIFRDGLKFRVAESDVWTRAMTVAREIMTAYPFLILMLILSDIPETRDMGTTVSPSLASLFTFGMWLQIVGPRLSDQSDTSAATSWVWTQKLLDLGHFSKTEKRKYMRSVVEARRNILLYFGVGIVVDSMMIVMWAPWFTNGFLFILPVCVSHILALIVVSIRAKRAEYASIARWMRVTQTGRQLLLAQVFLFFVLIFQIAHFKGPVIDMTVAVIQLLTAGCWILIFGQGRTAYVEAMAEIDALSVPGPLAAEPKRHERDDDEENSLEGA